MRRVLPLALVALLAAACNVPGRGGQSTSTVPAPPASTAVAPSRARTWSAPQCVVARRPSSSPACASTSDPVQTAVVHVVVASTARTHSMTSGTARAFVSPGPPGMSSTSARSISESAAVASMPSEPTSVRTVPRAGAAKVTVTPGIRLSTS